MTCYLGISSVESECEGCGRAVPPGLAGWTDELLPGRLRPLCSAGLPGLDPELARVLRRSRPPKCHKSACRDRNDQQKT